MSIITLVAVCFLIYQCDAQLQTAPAAVVLHPPAYTTAVATQTIRMTCGAYGIPTPNITWTRGINQSNNLLSDSDYRYKIVDQEFTVDGVEFVLSILEICGVDVMDTDEYICTAWNGVTGIGITDSDAKFFLSVSGEVYSEPPSIVVHPPNITTVDSGSTVEAVCIAYGYPIPWITWAREDCKNISSCSDSAIVYNEIVTYGDVAFYKSVLQLCNVQMWDDKWYSCMATNELNETSWWSWQLIVNPPPPTTTSTSSTMVPTSSSSSIRFSTTSASTSASISSSPSPSTEGTTERSTQTDNSRPYQIAMAIEGVIIVILIVAVIIGIVITVVTAHSKGKTVIGLPKAPQSVGNRNPLHGDGDPDAYEDVMTYTDLAKKLVD